MLAARIALLASVLANLAAAAPAILFTDIESGPVTGGHFDQGAPISIYGTGFGADRKAARVTIGGVEVADYILWGAHNATNPDLDKIVVQPGSRVTSGPIVVTVDGVASNGVSYTVRPGRLFLISVAGSDANDCSFDRACATLAHVVKDVMRPGDTVLLRGGTYPLNNLNLAAADSGQPGAPKTIAAYPREDVFLNGGAQLTIDNVSYVTFAGLHFLQSKVSAGLSINSVRFVDNEVPFGVLFLGGGMFLAGNTCQPDFRQGVTICFDLRSLAAESNTQVLHNRAIGAILMGIRASSMNNIVLDGNTVTGTQRQAGIEIDTAVNVTARNNVLAGNNPAGIWIGANATGVKLRNNTFFQNGRAGIVVDGFGNEEVEIRNNLFFQTMSFCNTDCNAPLAHISISDRSAGTTIIERNFYQTPQPVIYGGADLSPVDGNVFFYDAAAANYRLAGGSIALDAGLALPGEDHDADGQARPRGAGVDIGAYEAAENIAPPPPPPVPGKPVLSVDTTSLNFTGTQGAGNPSAQQITVYNAGESTLNWKATPSAAWLKVSPDSSSAQSQAVVITVDAAGLAPDTYNATVLFRDSDAGQEQRVTVTFVLAEAPAGSGSGDPGGTPAAGDPVIFFTDLESGPNSGGENNGGAVVTIYGKNFGASRGASKVAIGGGEVVAYKQWGASHQWYEKIAVQIGSAARSGNLVVTVNGRPSNAVPFTVRGGNIYFLGPNGSDSNDGGYAKPWRNAPTARDRMKAGDIVYLLDGFSQTNDDGQGWNTPLLFRSGGGADAPLTWAAYPGATVTLGSTTGPGFGIRMTDREPFGNIVFAGIRFRGSIVGALIGGVAPGGPGYRFIANDFEGRSSSCFITQVTRNLVFHGNTAHDCGATSKTPELEHGVYFSTDSNGIDMGWNTVANIPSCRGIQVHSSPLEGTTSGFNQYTIKIHHNVIRDTFCDGIVLATVDPSKGSVEVYNNLFLRAGYGTPIQEHGFFSCFYSPGTTNQGAAGSGNVELYNNTMVNCGNAKAGAGWSAGVVNGGQNAKLGIRLRNNIVVNSPGVPYSLYGPITGSNNLFFAGSGALPANLASSIAADPQFRTNDDFHLKPGSPAADTGVGTGVAIDLDGAPRPAGAAMDLGAYEVQP